jgi:hypothetical protein
LFFEPLRHVGPAFSPVRRHQLHDRLVFLKIVSDSTSCCHNLRDEEVSLAFLLGALSWSSES